VPLNPRVTSRADTTPPTAAAIEDSMALQSAKPPPIKRPQQADIRGCMPSSKGTDYRSAGCVSTVSCWRVSRFDELLGLSKLRGADENASQLTPDTSALRSPAQVGEFGNGRLLCYEFSKMTIMTETKKPITVNTPASLPPCS